MNHAYRDSVRMWSPDTHALVARAEAIFAETRETEEVLEENIRWSWELRQQNLDTFRHLAARCEGAAASRVRAKIAPRAEVRV
jgi:hypothetical protein